MTTMTNDLVPLDSLIEGAETPTVRSDPKTGNVWRVEPAVQRQRDADAARIRRGEQSGYEGFIPTSTVVAGSKIDRSRPILENPDGTFSTEETITEQVDGRWYNIPTIIGGKRVPPDEAVRLMRQGKNPHVGAFKSLKEAEAAAVARSKEIGRVREGDRGTKQEFTLEELGFGVSADRGFGAGFSRKDEYPADYNRWSSMAENDNVAVTGRQRPRLRDARPIESRNPKDRGFAAGLGTDYWSQLPDRSALHQLARGLGWTSVAPGTPPDLAENPAGAVVGRTQRRTQRPPQPDSKLLEELAQGFKERPAEMVGGLVRGVLDNPWMVLPFFARTGLSTVLGGGRLANSVDAAVLNAGLNSAMETVKQMHEKGQVNTKDVEMAAAIGAAIGLPMGLAGKQTGRPTSRRAEESPGNFTTSGPRPWQAPPNVRARREPQTYEGTVVSEAEVLPLLAAPPESLRPADRMKLLQFNHKWVEENGLTAATGAALAAYTLLGERPEDGILGLGILGAMKAKGGMWHPKAAEVLSGPIANALNRNVQQRLLPGGDLAGNNAALPDLVKQVEPTNAWSLKSARNYLNRYMGTAEDPLKDIEIPFGEGTKKWGEVTDSIIHSQKKAFWQGFNTRNDPNVAAALEKVPAGEPIWNIQAGFAPDAPKAGRALRSYLSHVGDYLRENVDPAKLPQYDLVRAVRETAKRDAEMAKAMEREAADATKDLPVYKEYPDGFKWVELKLPEKLTEEQLRQIRKNPELAPAGNYEALAADGRPIQNNYTNRIAEGSTPEAAYLAGQLAREGNSMGHCVGGYCEGVASGESRIFSLRDPKGKSHVTVEVAPPSVPPPKSVAAYEQVWPKVYDKLSDADQLAMDERAFQTGSKPPAGWVERHRPDIWQRYMEEYKAMFSPENESILQIKGKQNRAPVAEYQKYVQDFVRGGKWGEVGDLENTGLITFKGRDLSEEFAAALQKLDGEIKDYYTPDELLQGGAWKVLRNNEIPAGLAERIGIEPRTTWDLGTRKALTDRYGLRAYDTVSEVDAVLRERKDWSASAPSKAADNALREAELRAPFDDVDVPPRGERGSIDPRLLLIGAGAAIGAYFDDRPERGAALGAILGLGLSALKPGRGGALRGLDEALGRVSTRLGNIDPALTRRARDYELHVSALTEERYRVVEPFLRGAKKLSKDEYVALDAAYMEGDVTAIRQQLAGKPGMLKAFNATRDLLDKFKAQFETLGRFKEGLSDYLPRVVKDFDGLKAKLGQEARASLEKMMLAAETEMMKKRGRALTDVEKSSIFNRWLKAEEQSSSLPGFARARRVKMREELRPFYATMEESLLHYVSAATQDVETAKFFGRDLRTNAAGKQKFTDVDDSVGALIARATDEGRMTPEQALVVRDILRARFGPGESAPDAWAQHTRNISNTALLGQFSSAATQVGDVAMSFYHHGLRPTLEGLGLKLLRKGVDPKDFGLANHIAEEFSSNVWSGKVVLGALKLNAFRTIDQFAKGVNLTAGLQKNKRLARSPAGTKRLEEKWGASYGDDMPQLLAELRVGKRTPLVDSLLWAELSNAQPISKMEMPQAYLEHPNGRLLWNMKSYMLTQADVLRRDAYNEIKSGQSKRIARGLKNLAAFGLALSLSNVPGDIVKDFIAGRNIDLDIDWVENLLRNFGISRYAMEQAERGKPVEVARDIVLPPYKHVQDIIKMDKKSVAYIPPGGRMVYDRMLGGNEKRKAAEDKRRTREMNKLLGIK